MGIPSQIITLHIIMIPLWGSERHIKIYVHYYVRISDVNAPLGL